MSATTVLSPPRAISLGYVPQMAGFFFAVRVCITVVFFQSAPVAGSAVYNAASVVLAYFAWAVTQHNPSPTKWSTTTKWVAVYIIFIGLSIAWSYTKSPAVAVAYWLAIVSDCAAVLFLLRAGDESETCEGIMTGYVYGALVVSAVAWTLPTMSDLRIGNEDFLHPNAVGYVTAIALLFAIYLTRRSRIMTVLAILCGCTLARSLSKTALSAAFAAIAYYLVRDSHLRRRTKVLITFGIALLIIAGWGLLEAYVYTYAQEYHIETLTGRTYLWAMAWEEGIKTPWLGHGLYSIRAVLPWVGDFQPWHAHNEFLQQFFAFGILGISLYTVMYLSFVRDLRRHAKSPFSTLAGALMIFALVRGFGDTEIVSVNYPLWLLILFSATLSRTLSLAK